MHISRLQWTTYLAQERFPRVPAIAELADRAPILPAGSSHRRS
jgi:hypothetical protein